MRFYSHFLGNNLNCNLSSPKGSCLSFGNITENSLLADKLHLYNNVYVHIFCMSNNVICMKFKTVSHAWKNLSISGCTQQARETNYILSPSKLLSDQQWMFCMHAVLGHFSHVRLFSTLWTVACQAPPSMGFSRWEYWSGLLCPLLKDLPDPGIEPLALMSSALTGCLPLATLGKS